MTNKLKNAVKTIKNKKDEKLVVELDNEKILNLMKEVLDKNYSYIDIKNRAEKLNIAGMYLRNDTSLFLDVDFMDEEGDRITLPSNLFRRRKGGNLSCRFNKIYVRDTQYPSNEQNLSEICTPRSIFITMPANISEDLQDKGFERAALEWTKFFIRAYRNMNIGDSLTIAQMGKMNYLEISRLLDDSLNIETIGEIFKDKEIFQKSIKASIKKAGVSYVNLDKLRSGNINKRIFK